MSRKRVASGKKGEHRRLECPNKLVVVKDEEKTRKWQERKEKEREMKESLVPCWIKEE